MGTTVTITNKLSHVLHLPPIIKRQTNKDGSKIRDSVGKLSGPIIAQCESIALAPGENQVPAATWDLLKDNKVVQNYVPDSIDVNE